MEKWKEKNEAGREGSRAKVAIVRYYLQVKPLRDVSKSRGYFTDSVHRQVYCCET